jgi:hypothetical protein
MTTDDLGALLSFLVGVFLMIVIMAACSYSRRRQEDDNNRRQEAAAGMAAALLDSVSHPRRNAGAAGGSDDHTSAATTTVADQAASAAAEECAICLVQFEDGDWCSVMPGCRHEFHRSCITKWLTANNNTCPLCRGQLEWIAVTHDHDMAV